MQWPTFHDFLNDYTSDLVKDKGGDSAPPGLIPGNISNFVQMLFSKFA